MPDKRSIMQGECISENMQSWCRSVVGGMHFFAIEALDGTAPKLCLG